MILIPLPHNGKTNLLIVLEDDNLERIKEHDNAEVIWGQLPITVQNRPGTIAIAYASPAEMSSIKEWVSKGEIDKALKLLTGGWRFRPSRGDHNRGPEKFV